MEFPKSIEISGLIASLEQKDTKVGVLIRGHGEVVLFYELEDGSRKFIQKDELLYRNSIGNAPIYSRIFKKGIEVIVQEHSDLDLLFMNAEHAGFTNIREYLDYTNDLIKQTT